MCLSFQNVLLFALIKAPGQIKAGETTNPTPQELRQIMNGNGWTKEQKGQQDRTGVLFHPLGAATNGRTAKERTGAYMENIEEFKRHDKTRFRQDNFIESIEFDYLEIHVIEE